MNCKKIVKTFLMIIGIFCIFTCTQTEAKTCTTQEKNNLIQLAYNVKFDYELSEDRSSTQGLRFYKITISNLTPEIYVKYNGFDYIYDKTSTNPGVETLVNLFETNQTYSFKLYSSNSTNCKDQYLISRTVRTPAYNVYSELAECNKYPEFKLCDKNYSGKITDDQFKMELEKYKEDLAQPEKKEEQKKTKTLIETIISVYIDNLKVTIPLTIILLGIIIIIIYKLIKVKRRPRIDL